MFEDAEPVLAEIVKLAENCPDKFQAKCFEILLAAYAATKAAPQAPPRLEAPASPTPSAPAAPSVPQGIPEVAKGRFGTVAARLKVPVQRLADLFDFESDPFVYHALDVPGENKAEKMRNVALLLAAKSYLAGGPWSADWREFKAMCVDQDCYERNNITNNINAKKNWFKTASSADGITLGSAGITEAQTLLTQLASRGEPTE